MSTRCQVTVIQEGLSWQERLTLYHHCDGYPSYMLPVIQQAWDLSHGGWEAGSAGTAASYLCAADPGQMEPEEGHALHGDIEYFYRLFVSNEQNGTIGERPVWEVEVLETGEGWWGSDGLKTEESLVVLIPRMRLAEALKHPNADR